MDKGKIVLISTYPDIQAYGIRLLSSILKAQGFTTYLVFLNAPFGALYPKEILDELAQLSRGSIFVGVTLMTNFFGRAEQVTLFLKERLKIPVVWGGIHTAIKPEECLTYADMICIGEAENIIVPLSQNLAAGSFNHIDNLWFKADGKIIKNRITPSIEDINELPFPDYEYAGHFIIDKNRLTRMDLKLMEQYMGYEYSTIATRGCFYNCTFCANNFFEKNFNMAGSARLRSRSMGNVIEELQTVKKLLKFIRIFKFSDDLFMALPRATIEEFCSLYRGSGLNLPLDITGVHPLILKEEKFKLLIDAGLKYVRMGIQSGSNNVRKIYGRNESGEKVMEGIKVIHKYRSRLKSVYYDFMVDNPWETEEDVKDSLRLLSKIPRPYQINIFSLTLYPGTQLYNRAKEEKLITDEGLQIYDKHYHDNAGTSYYNELFRIISSYRLPEWCTSLLIEDKESPLAKIIFIILHSGVKLTLRLKRLYYLAKEGIFDIKNGRLERINKFIFLRPKVVH